MPSNDSKNTGAQRKVTKKAKPMKVYLSENAFMDLLLSSAEVFKKESQRWQHIGKHGKFFLYANAIPQKARIYCQFPPGLSVK